MLLSLLVFLACILATTARWLTRKFGLVTLDQILFHLNMPIDAEQKLINSCLGNVLGTATVAALLFYLLVARKYIQAPKWQNVLYCRRRCLAGLVLALCLVYACCKVRVDLMWRQYNHFQTISTYFEDNYIDPRKVMVSFPEHKRNLILIFMESMDTAHIRSKYYDYFNTDLTPELRKLAYENINFSNNDDIGGAYQINGTNFTQAGLTAQTCGLPLRIPVSTPHFRPQNGFLPDAKCLFEFLQEHGYAQTLINGMPGSFGGLDKFLESHGNIRLMDTKLMRKEGLLNFDDYSEGTKIVKDSSLIRISKQEIERLASSGKPFGFIMMTIDTHLGKQYFDQKSCTQRFADTEKHSKYKNIFSCQSQLLGEFVNWIKQQPFYNNTTIIMLGDHQVMYDSAFIENMKKGKKILNIFINPARIPAVTKNREFLSFDIYPTILEALGAQVKGGKLGLGTSLYGIEPTLAEREKSVKKIDKQLDMRSKFYEKMLYGHVIGEK